jgi:serine/threonine protein kinase/uncharacterized protein with ATP-grasp and redox domains
MSEYKIVNNYFIYDELNTDSIGTNYRAGEIKGKKAEEHSLLTEVYPNLSGPLNVWKRIVVLIEGIKKPNISGLYCPEKIVKEEDRALLVYPFVNGKTLEGILEDATRTDTPIEMELALSIAFGIADVLDTGTTIIINKKASFHGILTPDNIIMDMDGKVYLKNYGIFPYLGDASQLLTETINKYDKMLAPEILHNEDLTSQTDVYHLGNIIHRLLTGKYFHYSSEEDFEAQLKKIDLMEHSFTSDEDIEPKILELFKKTLNPDPSQRFASVMVFKEYLSRHFRIEELSSATYVLAYFLNQLYMKTTEEDEKLFKKELDYTLPEERPQVEESLEEKAKIDEHLVEDILIELEQQKRSRVRLLVPLIAVIVALLGFVGYMIINQQQEAKRQEEKALKERQEMEQRITQMRQELSSEYQKRLKAIEEKAATTEDQKTARDKEIERLKKWREEQEERVNQEQLRAKQLEMALAKKESEALQEKRLEEQRKQAEQRRLEREKQEQEEAAKNAAEAAKEENKPGETSPAITPGGVVPMSQITYSPSKLQGKRRLLAKNLKLPREVLKRYSGKRLDVQAEILVSELGNVVDTKIKGDIPPALQAKVKPVLKTWTFIPGEKDKTKVKVWIPAEISVTFEKVVLTEADIIKDVKVTPLEELTHRPSKLSGERRLTADGLKLAKDIKKKYKGQSLTVSGSLLLSENGSVIGVKIKGSLPDEIKSNVTLELKTWRYIPAQKGDEKVKVWFPAKVYISFK